MTSKPSSQMAQITGEETTDPRWKGLYKASGAAAIALLLSIPIQIIIFIAWPPPSTVEGFFTVFQNNWFLGLLNLDLLYMLTNVLMILIFLGLYAALRQVSQSYMAIGLTLSLVGIAVYFASNTAFEMLSLSGQYAAATTDAQRAMFLGAGQVMLEIYQGTAFALYYILTAVALLIFSAVMLRSNIFSKVTAYVGILMGVLMLVPSTAGTIGLYFALISLAPTAIWFILIARRLFRLGQPG
jgi:hypothetical protein